MNVTLSSVFSVQANAVFLPKGNSYKRDRHHAVEQKGEEDDDDEHIEKGALTRTEATSSSTVFDTRAVEKLLQPERRKHVIFQR